MAKRGRDIDECTSTQIQGGEDLFATKYVHMDVPRSKSSVMECALPPHQYPVSFASYEDFDVHYTKFHCYRCSECDKNFPSERFLHLHIAENHDPINEVKRARGDKTYACFVEDCDKLCSTPQKRRLHLLDKHHFPKFYDFYIVNDGLGRRNTMLRTTARRSGVSSLRSSEGRELSRTPDDDLEETVSGFGIDHPATRTRGSGEVLNAPGEVVESKAEAEAGIDGVTQSIAALKFIPPKVRFGKAKGGLARKK